MDMPVDRVARTFISKAAYFRDQDRLDEFHDINV